jgi:tetratricopeptide (TPR) repeat protein
MEIIKELAFRLFVHGKPRLLRQVSTELMEETANEPSVHKELKYKIGLLLADEDYLTAFQNERKCQKMYAKYQELHKEYPCNALMKRMLLTQVKGYQVLKKEIHNVAMEIDADSKPLAYYSGLISYLKKNNAQSESFFLKVVEKDEEKLQVKEEKNQQKVTRFDPFLEFEETQVLKPAKTPRFTLKFSSDLETLHYQILSSVALGNLYCRMGKFNSASDIFVSVIQTYPEVKSILIERYFMAPQTFEFVERMGPEMPLVQCKE